MDDVLRWLGTLLLVCGVFLSAGTILHAWVGIVLPIAILLIALAGVLTILRVARTERGRCWPRAKLLDPGLIGSSGACLLGGMWLRQHSEFVGLSIGAGLVLLGGTLIAVRAISFIRVGDSKR